MSEIDDWIAEARVHANDMPAVIQRDYLLGSLDKLADLRRKLEVVREAMREQAECTDDPVTACKLFDALATIGDSHE